MRSLGTTGLRTFVFGLAFGLAPATAWAGEPPASEGEVEPVPVDANTFDDTAPVPEPDTRTFTDLGTIRYVDPVHRRELWLGLDVGGAYVPEQLGLFPRTLWTLRFEPAWAMALTPWLTAGGRHGLIWYDAENIRARYHHHELELSGRPTAGSKKNLKLSDRLAFGFEHHNLRLADLEGDEFKLGGVLDYVIRLGYGMRHPIGDRIDIDWGVQGRYVWLFQDTQRQVRGSVRLLGRPGKNPEQPHQLGVELVGYIVHRDESQFGNDLQRTSAVGQVALTYEWMSRRNLGVFTKARFTTSLFTGEAPVYEVREEALNNVYGEASVGFRWAWE